jgi:hypothetical protein
MTTGPATKSTEQFSTLNFLTSQNSRIVTPLEPSAIFRLTALKMAAVLMLAAVPAIALACWMTSTAWQLQSAIAAASIAISIIALCPGMLLPMVGDGGLMKRSLAFTIGCTAAMVIRGVGTVALIPAAGYYLGRPDGTNSQLNVVGFVVAFWYVMASTLEVSLLARQGRNLDQTPTDALPVSVVHNEIIHRLTESTH